MSAENDSTKGPLTQMRSAKNYMDENKIPQMFQSLIASLMLEKPENHFDFLDDKLEALKEVGLENVNWESFILDLHPTKDAVRQEMIQDGQVYKPKPPPPEEGQASTSETRDGNAPENEEDYEPQLFELTEAQD